MGMRMNHYLRPFLSIEYWSDSIDIHLEGDQNPGSILGKIMIIKLVAASTNKESQTSISCWGNYRHIVV
jgi:hypothetical protein